MCESKSSEMQGIHTANIYPTLSLRNVLTVDSVIVFPLVSIQGSTSLVRTL